MIRAGREVRRTSPEDGELYGARIEGTARFVEADDALGHIGDDEGTGCRYSCSGEQGQAEELHRGEV